VIDLHSHILWGLDDGASTPARSLEMARAAVADGIRVVAATPHVRADWPTSAAEMERAVEALRAAVEAEGIPLDVRTGGEIDLEQLPRLGPDDLRRFGLAGNPGYLLVETPYVGWPDWLDGRVLELAATGVTPVLAHPERNREVRDDPERLRPLVEGGALAQLTAASLDGRGSRSARACARELLDLGLAHLVASDAHEPRIREIGMSRAAEALGDDALAAWLTEGVPGAIAAGTELPPRPLERVRA
jgi:protein-tyrosine phosphatase